jgi:hydroxymethylglutaryl-CoA reductase
MTKNERIISGFSKLNRSQRIDLIWDRLGLDEASRSVLDNYLHQTPATQSLFEEMSENFLTNFLMPMGVVPNMVVNGHSYIVPMVIEESSVIAAASRAAKFWASRGGFHARVTGMVKKGQVHFSWSGKPEDLKAAFPFLKAKMLAATHDLTARMRKRGGGITAVELVDRTRELAHYYQVDVSFETADAMGANFINSCLENMAGVLVDELSNSESSGEAEVIMSILSNYTPESLVECWVECDVDELAPFSGKLQPDVFARKFEMASRIAQLNVSRAVTHNKGIYNGVDAVVLATGNDWRAVEACGHAFAASDGNYRSLTFAEIDGNHFRYTLRLPLALGTVGGLTKTHPVSKLALELLESPNAETLMMIAAAAGLANNFAAVASLTTVGIQKGHMKMHLTNILNQLGATADEKSACTQYFSDKDIAYAAVEKYLNQIRNTNG